MNILIFIPGLVTGIFVYIWVKAFQEAHKHRTGTKDEFMALCAVPWELSFRQGQIKENIFKLIKERRKIMRETIRREMKISCVTLDRCIKELEKEDRVEEAERGEHVVFYQVKE